MRRVESTSKKDNIHGVSISLRPFFLQRNVGKVVSCIKYGFNLVKAGRHFTF